MLVRDRFCDQVDDRDADDRVAVIAAYLRHNGEVRAGVLKERLLEWSASEGWEPICGPLGAPVPEVPFSKANSTAGFREMLGVPPLGG